MVYRLYRWVFSPFGFGIRPTRGGLLATCHTYMELKAQGRRRAWFAGYCELDDWMYLFDWEREGPDGKVRVRSTRNQHPAPPDKKKRAHGRSTARRHTRR